MAEVKDLTSANKAQVENSATIFVIASDGADTDTLADDAFKVPISVMKAVFGVVPSVATITSLGTTYTNLGSPMADTDVIAISVKATLSGNTVHDGDTFVVGAFSTATEWIPIKGGESGARIEITKGSTGQIQVRRAGPISNVRVDLIKFT